MPLFKDKRVSVAFLLVKTVPLFSFQSFPGGQLDGDSPFRVYSILQRFCGVVRDTKLCLSLNDCQSALIHSDLSGCLPLSCLNSPPDTHWQPCQLSQALPSFQTRPLTDWLDSASLRQARRTIYWPQGVADWRGCGSSMSLIGACDSSCFWEMRFDNWGRWRE